jgi:hypothetical protein
MHTHSACSRRHRLLGRWLVLLALCALSLQALQHYQPRMLADVCGAGARQADASPDGKAGQQGGDCGACCARTVTAIAATAPPVRLVLPQRAAAVVGPRPGQPAVSRDWSAGRPRGPPGLA